MSNGIIISTYISLEQDKHLKRKAYENSTNRSAYLKTLIEEDMNRTPLKENNHKVKTLNKNLTNCEVFSNDAG